MSSLPFIIRKFAFSPKNTVDIVDLGAEADAGAAIPGYFVMSSAPPNIEEAQELSPETRQQARAGIAEITEYLYRRLTDSAEQTAELVIVVHGYNTSRSSVETWYKAIFKTINQHDRAIKAQTNSVFIGYRWPSEKVGLSDRAEVIAALAALPPVPRDLLMTGGLCALLLLLFDLSVWDERRWGLVVSLALGLLVSLGLLVLSLVVLRLVVYFRDRYRAENFGVLDLVELLRQIDQAILVRSAQDLFPGSTDGVPTEEALHQARDYWRQRSHSKVKLSFIGHSMGGFVVTHVVRLLADVFDISAVGKQPTADVGSIFRLERLILASPDIPVLTIISSRANFLASSLRRFSESYLFCNEGDIALRIASTAANYIAFPSRTQSRGYRLGNVALQNRHSSALDYGLINLNSLDRDFPEHLPIGDAIEKSDTKVMENLFLTYKRFQKRGAVTLADLFETQGDRNDPRSTQEGHRSQVTVADFFTYFDCTDYADLEYNPETDARSAKPMGLLTRAKGKATLTPWDYLVLTLDYGLGKRDVHGGYFKGEFSQQLLYGLAFLGFSDYLATLHPDPQVALSQLHSLCQQKQIQGFLSPFRYRVSIQGGSLEGSKQELLEAIRRSTAIRTVPFSDK
jgi:hypothetical protein